MLRLAGWEAWGVVLRRQWVWDHGGGPVWYVRDDTYRALGDQVDQRLRSWWVRTEPQDSDWLHEREWRVPCTGGTPWLDLTDQALVAILVADARWEPPLGLAMDLSPMSGDFVQVEQTRPEHLVPRWHWSGDRLDVLEPISIRTNYWEF